MPIISSRLPATFGALLATALLVSACGKDDKKTTASTPAGKTTVVPAKTSVPRYAGDPSATRAATLSSVATFKQQPRSSTVAPKVRGSDVPMAQFLDTVSNDVATYWQKIFNTSKLRFPKTTQAVVSGSASSPCGTISGTAGPPRYCPADQTIYLPVGYFENKVAPIGDAATVTLVGLLWGYRVQDALGAFKSVESGRRRGIDVNLGAICMAGSYMANVANRNLLEAGDVQEILKTAAVTGDQGTPPDVTRSKGTPAQRIAAFRIGFSRGPAACQRVKAT